MKITGGKNLIIAVVFSTLLLMGSGAQASGLFALDGNSARAERQIGLFDHALSWLTGAWSNLTSVFAYSEETPKPQPSQECTENCGDAGPGIDPIG